MFESKERNAFKYLYKEDLLQSAGFAIKEHIKEFYAWLPDHYEFDETLTPEEREMEEYTLGNFLSEKFPGINFANWLLNDTEEGIENKEELLGILTAPRYAEEETRSKLREFLIKHFADRNMGPQNLYTARIVETYEEYAADATSSYNHWEASGLYEELEPFIAEYKFTNSILALCDGITDAIDQYFNRQAINCLPHDSSRKSLLINEDINLWDKTCDTLRELLKWEPEYKEFLQDFEKTLDLDLNPDGKEIKEQIARLSNAMLYRLDPILEKILEKNGIDKSFIELTLPIEGKPYQDYEKDVCTTPLNKVMSVFQQNLAERAKDYIGAIPECLEEETYIPVKGTDRAFLTFEKVLLASGFNLTATPYTSPTDLKVVSEKEARALYNQVEKVIKEFQEKREHQKHMINEIRKPHQEKGFVR